MEKEVNVQPLMIGHRRWKTFLYAAVFLLVSLIFISVPVLTFIIPIEAEAGEIIGFRLWAFVIAILLGVPLLSISISLFVRLKRKYAVMADEKGIYLYSGIFSFGFLPWDNIGYMEFHGERLSGRWSRALEAVLINDMPGLNFYWRFRLGRLRTKEGQPRLLISFSLCKGRDEENAQNIIRLWEQYKRA